MQSVRKGFLFCGAAGHNGERIEIASIQTLIGRVRAGISRPANYISRRHRPQWGHEHEAGIIFGLIRPERHKPVSPKRGRLWTVWPCARQ